jgi:hypothetical protein
MTTDFPYVKLPGSYHGFFRKASLWEGVDHILLVSGSRFSEEYRRFYYRDIQALLVEKRPRAGSPGWWIILSILLIIAIISTGQNDPPYSWVGLAVLSLILLVRLDLTFRRSCRCSIQTAVSREVLPSLIRRRDAENAMSRLRTRIIAEQGELPDEIPFSESEEGRRRWTAPRPGRCLRKPLLLNAAGLLGAESTLRFSRAFSCCSTRSSHCGFRPSPGRFSNDGRFGPDTCLSLLNWFQSFSHCKA